MVPIEHRDLMVEAYLAGKSAETAATAIGYSGSSCLRELKRRNIKACGHKKYSFNENFFNEIDTEKKAYWLGFITADGYVGRERLMLGLGKKDKGHIKKFLHDIESDHVIYDDYTILNGKKYARSTVEIYSRHLYDSMAKYGINGNKTFSIKPNEKMPWELKCHYLRGFLDADGSIIKNYASYKNIKYTHPWWRVQFLGNKYIIDWIRSFIFFNTGIDKKIHKARNIFVLYYDGKFSVPIVSFIFSNAGIFLDRKKLLADRVLDYYKEKF